MLKENVSRLVGPCLRVLVWSLLACLALSRSQAQAPPLLQGQVLDASTGLPVEGARLLLDRIPTGDPIEGIDTASAFGLFRFAAGAVPPGSYELRTSHPAYVEDVRMVTIGAAPSESLRIELQKISGENFFDVYTQVSGVVTGIPLGPSEETLVTLRKFGGDAGGAAEGAWQATTDPLGSVVFRGLQEGFYEFEITTAGDWEPYTSSRKFFNAPQQANFYLKPNAGPLTVSVSGWNPAVMGMSSITNVFVELTGFDPRDLTAPVVPTRTGVTESGGSVLFTDLPPVEWEVVTRRLGYQSQTNRVGAAQVGGAVEVNLMIEERALRLTLVSEDYENPEVFRGLAVTLQGVPGSNTEGYELELTEPPGEGGSPDVRLYDPILPGRYRVVVNGEGNSEDLMVHPGFVMEDTFEIYETGTVEMELMLKTKLAVVYGRLLAADERSKADSADQSEAEALGRPRYQRKAADEVAFIEYELDSILMPTMRTNIVQTDENGFFMARLKPAQYGILIEELDEYWGSHVNLELVTPDPLENAPNGMAPSGPDTPSAPIDPPNIPDIPDIPDIPGLPTLPNVPPPVDPTDPGAALDLLDAIGLVTDLVTVPPDQLTPDLLDDDDDPQAVLDAADLLGIPLSPQLRSFLQGLVGMAGGGGDGGMNPPGPIVPPLPMPGGPGQSQFFAAGQGWPFYQDWPYSGRPPRNGTPMAGEPLAIHSEQYSMDVFVRKQVLTVMNSFGNGLLSSPTKSLVSGFSAERAAFLTSDFSELAELGTVATLTSAATGRLEADILTTAGNVTDFFAFHNVPAGDYVFDIDNDRFEYFGTAGLGGPGPPPSPDFLGEPILPLSFTVRDWNPPGVLPDRDPSDPDEFEPLSGMPPGGFSAFAAFGALAKDEAFHVTWDIQTWVPDPEVVGTELEETVGEYEAEPMRSTEEGDLPSFIRTAYAGNLVFRSPPRLPVGPYEYWDDIFSRWQSVSQPLNLRVFYGGPSNNVPENPMGILPDPETGAPGGIPIPRTEVKITVVNEAESDFELQDISVRLRSGDTEFMANSGSTIVVTDSVKPLEVTGQGWLGFMEISPLEGGLELRHSFVTLDPTVTRRELIIPVKRGMNLKGTATIAEASPGTADTPLPKGEVLIRDRFGVILFKTRTDAEGVWELDDTLEILDESSQSLYVEVRSPGYKPWRRRYSPSEVMQVDGGFFIVAESALEPLPQPELVSIEFDKADNGLYLPGVSRAGNQGNYSRLRSPGPLQLGWTVRVDATPQTFELVGFDDGSGNPGTPEMITVFNLPDTVYLIDPKGNTGNPSDSEMQFAWVPENPNNVAELRAWLNDIKTGAAPNVFFDDALTFTPLGGNQWEAVGSTDIWRLPPGLFRPLMVLESENGGVTFDDPYDVLEIPPTNTDPETPRLMTGIGLPPWLAFTAEMFGAVAAADSLAGGLKPEEDEIVAAAPKGRFRMRPEFEATITEMEGKIDYDYRAAVKWSEGLATPDSGFLKIAANQMGLVFDTEVRVGARGSENRVFIEGGAGVSNPEIDVDDYLPRALKGKVEAEGSAEVMAMITLEEFITPRDEIFPVQMRLSNQVSGAVQSTLRYNMTPILSKIPTVGPVILSLDKTEALQIIGRLQGGIGANFVNRWTTFYPVARGGTTGVINHVFERHQFGGRAPGDGAADNTLNLCFNFGVGMDINLAGGRLGANGTLSVQGENCGLTSLPALQITPNLATDWPPLERVDGTLTASMEAFLDVWVTRFEKRWEWDLIKISHQFGTDPVEDIRPIGLASTVFSPMTASPTVFDPDPDSGVLVSDLFPAASFAAATGAAAPTGAERLADGTPSVHALAYTDVNPANGAMRLQASFRAGTEPFTAPVTVAEAPGVVAVTIGQHNGVWTTAWTELGADALSDAFPSSQVRVSESQDGGVTWSAPVLVATLSGVANELELVGIGDQVGLLFLHTNEGPASSRSRLGLAVANQANWQTVSEDATGDWVETARVEAGPVDAAIVFRTPAGALNSVRWTGNTIGEVVTIADASGAAYGLSFDSDAGYQLAWANDLGDILLSSWAQEGSAWSDPNSLVPGVYPSELAVAALPDAGSARTVVAWIDSADVKSVWRTFVSGDGQALDAGEQLSLNERGRHTGLNLWVGEGGRVRVLARFDDGGASLREYETSPSSPIGGVGELRLEIVRVLADGGLSLRASGDAEGTFALEVSNDLRTWRRVSESEFSALPAELSVPASELNGAATVFLRGVQP